MSTSDQPHVAVLFFVAHREVERRVREALADAGHPVTPAQGRIAARISPDGSRVTELAESAQVTKQTASILVDQLERLGYVERTPDPTDARARLVRMSDRGRAAVAIARGVEEQVRREWQAHLGARDYARLESQMGRLREITDPYGPSAREAGGSGRPAGPRS